MSPTDEELAKLQANPDHRNVRLLGSHLFMQDTFRYEQRTIHEWYGDEASETWSEAGLMSPREPTVEEVKAWLAIRGVT